MLGRICGMNSSVALYDVGDTVQVIPIDEMRHLSPKERWVGVNDDMIDMGDQEYEVVEIRHISACDTYVYRLEGFWFSDNLLMPINVLNPADDESLDNLIM